MSKPKLNKIDKALAIAEIVSNYDKVSNKKNLFKYVSDKYNIAERTLYNYIKNSEINLKPKRKEKTRGRKNKIKREDYYFIVKAYEKNVSVEEIASIMKVSSVTIYSLLYRFGIRKHEKYNMIHLSNNIQNALAISEIINEYDKYNNKDKLYTNIAKKYNISKDEIINYINDNNINIEYLVNKKKRKMKIPVDEYYNIVNKYNSGLTHYNIAKEYNVTRHTITRIINSLGYKIKMKE